MSKTYETIVAINDEICGDGNGTFGRCDRYHHKSRSLGCPVLNRIHMELQFGRIHLADGREADADPASLARWFVEAVGPYDSVCGAQDYDAPSCTKVSRYCDRVREALHADTVGRLGVSRVVVRELPSSCIRCPFKDGPLGWTCALTGCASNRDFDRAPGCPLVGEGG